MLGVSLTPLYIELSYVPCLCLSKPRKTEFDCAAPAIYVNQFVCCLTSV